jgi:hypothetical protein
METRTFVYDDEYPLALNNDPTITGRYLPQDVRCPHCYFLELIWIRNDVKELLVQCTTCGRANLQQSIRPEDAPDV